MAFDCSNTSGLAGETLLCLESVATSSAGSVGISRLELPRLCAARNHRYPAEAIFRQVLVAPPWNRIAIVATPVSMAISTQDHQKTSETPSTNKLKSWLCLPLINNLGRTSEDIFDARSYA
jgi:hypothetical protein